MLTFEKETDYLRRNLQGRMSNERIVTVLSNRAALKFEASEQLLTVMFIDIVGFSRTANKQTPTEAFAALKAILTEITLIVHEYGGDIDRTMGDAMLCVFGYNVAEAEHPENHADQALKCADAIQNANIRRIITRQSRAVVFPLRIGVNTTNAYIGNLGDIKRLDLTVIGDGVNFAQRLESACDRHMVLVGPSTKDYLRFFPNKEERLTKRLIRIKHQEELGEAFEFDPFATDPDVFRQAEAYYRESIGAERNEVRWPLIADAKLVVTTSHGEGRVVNFSLNGIAVKLDTYLAVGVTVSIHPTNDDSELSRFLIEHGLSSIVVVVRWARPTPDGFMHGLLYKNIGSRTRKSILELYRKTLSKDYEGDSNRSA